MNPTESPRRVDLGAGTALSRIVVPVTLDHVSDRGVVTATRLAERWGLPIQLTSVATSVPDTIDLRLDENLESAREALVASNPYVKADRQLIAGGPDPVTSLASELSTGDLVIMASSGAGADRRSMSFAQALSHEWGGPILMVGPNVDVSASLEGDVVAALDGSTVADPGIQAATGLAGALGSRLRLVRVVPGSLTAQVERVRYRADQLSEAAYVLDLTKRTGLPSVTWEIIHGDDTATALVEFVDATDAAFLAMATPAMFALVRPAFGSICTAVVQTATRPVIVIKPSRF